jgi:hypothetical protein
MKADDLTRRNLMADEFISQDDMDNINKQKASVRAAVAEAEKHTASAKIADLEYRNAIQTIFLKYGLKLTDQINDVDGRIIRTAVEQPSVDPEVVLDSQGVA